jgi:hypothetical protein
MIFQSSDDDEYERLGFDVLFLFCGLIYICGYICSCPGSTPLHLAAKGGSLDCIRELLAWGADRLQRDASGYILVSKCEFLQHG